MKNLVRQTEKIGFEWIAFFVILFFGICLRIFTPPFQLLDEIQHFPRAWQVSEGIFLSETEKVRSIEQGDNPMAKNVMKLIGDENGRLPLRNEDEKFLVAVVPSSMMPADYAIDAAVKLNFMTVDMLKNFLNSPLDLQKTEVNIIPNTGQYSPLAYFPQALAAFFGRYLNFSSGAIYYAMCLASLFFVAICVFFAMKILPEKKLFIFILAMMPMFLLEITSTSADSVTYGICLLGSAWFLSQRKNFEPITYREIFLLILFSICLGLLKSVYGTILLLYFLMPRQRFKKLIHFMGFGIFLLLLELIVSSTWNYFAINKQGVEIFNSFYMCNLAVDPSAQKNLLFENPMYFLKACFGTLTDMHILHLQFLQFFIGILGEYNTLLPEWFYWFYLATMIFFAMSGKMNFSLPQKLNILFALSVTFLGIFVIEYIIWSPVGGNLIEGIQGRYFIPIALFGFSIFSCLSPPKYANLIVLLIGIFGALVTIWTTYSAFY